MTTTIKITELTNIGANLASSTVIPVVNMAGTPTTEKTVLGNIANVVLAGAGGNYVAAAKANTATTANTVLTNAQPNITSVGTLSNVTVSGNASINGNITSNGTAYLGNISTTGYASITTLTVGASANLGAVGNVIITGGTNGQVLTTNGSGNLSWTTVSGGSNGTPGGSNTQIQFNDAGSFGGNTGFTFDKTTGIFTSPFVAGNGNGLSNIQGANVSGAVGLATYATTANAVAGANVSGFVPNANVANTAFAVAAANVSGLGNIATVNFDGNTSNVLLGNGVFGGVPGSTPASIANGNSNVNIANGNGNVTITSNGTRNWNFDTTGNLTTAGDLIGPANANFTIHSNASAHEFIFGSDGTFYAPDNVVLGGNSIYIGPGASTLSGIEHEVFIASSNLFPYVQAVVNNISDNGSADWVALGARGGDAGGQASLGFTSSGFGDANYTITGNGDGYVLVQSYAPGQTLLGGGGNLVLATGNQGSVKDIIFGTGGFLASNIFGRISHANNSLELTRTGATIKFTDSTVQNTAWTGSVSRIANGNSNVSIPTSNDNVYITTNSGSSKQWIFDTAGNLRTPGNVDIYGAINFPQQVSSLNWSTYNIELSQYGRINTNVDFFANANTIGALYLKGDGSNISNIAVANVVGLGNIATANLTGSNSNVLYGNGVFAAVAGGGANTGNVTFNNQIVLGTGSNDGSGGLYLAPGNASIANSAVQYLRVRGGDFPTHIHLDTGNNEFYDQYFGADSRFVKLEANGNVVINADDYNGNSGTWTFATDGILTFPGTPRIDTDANNFEVQAAEAINFEANTVVNIYTDTGNSAFQWQFGDDGTLTVPGNLVYIGASPAPSISGFNSVSAVAFTNGNSNVTVNANSNLWNFDSTGNLTIPSTSGGFIKTASNASIGIVAMDNGTNNPAQLLSMNVGNGNATSIVSAYSTNVAIQTNASGAINTWSFDNAGNLTLPGNTVAIKYANGSSAFGNIVAINLDGSSSNVLLGNGVFGAIPASSIIANGNSNVTIATAAGNVVTNVNGSAILTTYSGGIKVGGSGILQSPGGAGAITLNNNGANIPTANITNTLNVTGVGGANITANLNVTGNVIAQGVGTNLVRRANTISGSNTAVTLDNLTALVGGAPKRLYIGAATSNMTMAGQSQTMSTGALAVSSWINVPIVTGTGNGFAMSGAITNDGDTAVLNVTDQGAGSGTWRVTGMIANTSANLYSVSIERLA